MLEEMMAAKFRIERKAVDALQAGDSNPHGHRSQEQEREEMHIDPRAYMPLHQFFYDHLRKKYVLQPTVLLVRAVIFCQNRCSVL